MVDSVLNIKRVSSDDATYLLGHVSLKQNVNIVAVQRKVIIVIVQAQQIVGCSVC
jgi:hypothetical protein